MSSNFTFYSHIEKVEILVLLLFTTSEVVGNGEGKTLSWHSESIFGNEITGNGMLRPQKITSMPQS